MNAGITRRLSRIAQKVAEPDNDLGFDVMAMKVAEYLVGHPNPPDSKFHAWAKGEGFEPDDAEAAAYRLASTFSEFMFAGRAFEKGVTVDDVDPVEMSKGISVEMEHTDCRLISGRITLDHEAEAPDSPLGYYEGLLVLEKLREQLAGMPKKEAEAKIAAFKALVG